LKARRSGTGLYATHTRTAGIQRLCLPACISRLHTLYCTEAATVWACWFAGRRRRDGTDCAFYAVPWLQIARLYTNWCLLYLRHRTLRWRTLRAFSPPLAYTSYPHTERLNTPPRLALTGIMPPGTFYDIQLDPTSHYSSASTGTGRGSGWRDRTAGCGHLPGSARNRHARFTTQRTATCRGI